jgi:hypothetical protein
MVGPLLSPLYQIRSVQNLFPIEVREELQTKTKRCRKALDVDFYPRFDGMALQRAGSAVPFYPDFVKSGASWPSDMSENN